MSSSAVPFIVVVVVLFTLILCINVYLYIRRRRSPYRYKSFGNLEDQHQRMLAERDQKLAVEVRKRKLEEDDTASGSQVWFSRYVQHGRLKHWVLIIDGTKYELRRDRDTNNYIFNTSASTIDQEKREAALADLKVPEVDGYYVCLIGWTKLPALELKRICSEVMGQFGSYNLLWNNCQHFLQRFADRIITRKALDWAWFHDHAKTEYQVNQKFPPTPDEVIAAQRSAMMQANQQMQQQNLQNNINMMNQQLQISMMAQLQANTMATNQIMLQNQTMTPAMNPAMAC